MGPWAMLLTDRRGMHIGVAVGEDSLILIAGWSVFKPSYSHWQLSLLDNSVGSQLVTIWLPRCDLEKLSE